ncbi:MAG: type-F conjugative transfer system pilin assembly protein TrbC [Alphaproteobacteria bacterium]|nr:type-F conjugative transfer system pilin assembly protein TrbC [Alphaproteobacteria bacterium]
MLRFVIFIVFSMSYEVSASIGSQKARCRACSQTSLQTSPVEELARKGGLSQNIVSNESTFKLLQQESLQKVEALLQDKEFRDTVLLQNKASNSQNLSTVSKTEPLGTLSEASLLETSLSETSLYIFVSFSLGEKALLNPAQEAKRFGATLVLRGFKEGSYKKTAQSLQKIITKTGLGVLIDPELYSLFHITAVPTYILAKPFSLQSQERIQTPIKWAPVHDKLQGHVSVQYVLESFAKEGDLKREAQTLLKRGVLK